MRFHVVADCQPEFVSGVGRAFRGGRQREPAGRGVFDEVAVARAAPRTLQIERARHVAAGVFVFNAQATGDQLGQPADEFFDQVRHRIEIGVGPIRFEHGELGIVPAAETFVAEIAV